MDIDIKIKLEQLISECTDSKIPMEIHSDDFCDLLNSQEIPGYELNQRIKLKNPPVPCCEEGYYHSFKYDDCTFFAVTTVPISDL
jgi:hypothetical protein